MSRARFLVKVVTGPAVLDAEISDHLVRLCVLERPVDEGDGVGSLLQPEAGDEEVAQREGRVDALGEDHHPLAEGPLPAPPDLAQPPEERFELGPCVRHGGVDGGGELTDAGEQGAVFDSVGVGAGAAGVGVLVEGGPARRGRREEGLEQHGAEEWVGAHPPAGLESMVGSIYGYLADRHGVPAVMLEENYRSNAAIVGFTRRAGNSEALRAWSPDLSLALLAPLPTERPAEWPDAHPWCAAWSRLLDPAQATVCVVHPDERSSQWNRFEADAVASLLWLLHGRLARGLAG